MKRLLSIFLFVSLLFMLGVAFAYFTKVNFAGGVIASSDILTDGEGDGATFDVTMNEGAGDFPNSLTRIVVCSCSNCGNCASHEIIEIDAASCSGTYPARVCTLTVQARNAESTTHSGDWIAGSKVDLVATAGMEQEQEAAIDGKIANVVEDITPQLGGNLDGQTYNIKTSGFLNGGVVIIVKSSAYTIGTDDSKEAYRFIMFVSGTTEVILPAVGSGKGGCIYSTDATVKTISPNASDRLRIDWVALADDTSIVSDGTIGVYACLVYDSADGWTVLNHLGFASE